jgi:hypothetical protein
VHCILHMVSGGWIGKWLCRQLALAVLRAHPHTPSDEQAVKAAQGLAADAARMASSATVLGDSVQQARSRVAPRLALRSQAGASMSAPALMYVAVSGVCKCETKDQGPSRWLRPVAAPLRAPPARAALACSRAGRP